MMGRIFLHSTMEGGILTHLISFIILMTLSDVGAERIKLLPDSLLARGEKLVIGGRDAIQGAERANLHAQREKLVVGGRRPELGEVPYQVFITNLHTHKAFCGGAILNEYTVLTAAHCFDYTPDNFEFLQVVAGSLQWDASSGDKRRQTLNVSNFYKHPDYHKDFIFNDIAIVRVRTPFVFNEYVRNINLPEADSPYPSGEAMVSGWGSMAPGQTLSTVDVQLLSRQDCATELFLELNTILCAMPDQDHITKGDSGGALVQDEMVIGIVAGGYDSGLKCFTRVSEYIDWIHSLPNGLVKDEL